MARLTIQFLAKGNFAQLHSEIAQTSAALQAMHTELNKTQRGRAASAEVYRNLTNTLAGIEGIGMASMRAQTETANLTEGIRRQQLTFREGMRHMQKYRATVAQIADEQVRLRHAQGMVRSIDAMGRASGELIMPTGQMNDFSTSQERAAMRANVLNQALRSMSTNVVNMGKNMQWAGRQLFVGLTLPVLAAGAAMGKFAYDLDAQMVRLQKVYGDTAEVSEAELERVRKATMETAREVARSYGIMAADTVKLGAELAATGLMGEELQESIRETSRVMTLGEVTGEQAQKATVAIKSIFGPTTDLAETFNFLNAVENQTSTSLNDLTAGIPRAAGVIHALGGSVKDLSVFLVAMKERGIEAGEGANALRSALNRLINPPKVVSAQLLQMGIDIEKIVNNNAGNLMATLKELGGELAGLDNLARQQVIGRLFGTYQFNRISGLIDGLVAGTGQVSRALELTQADATELAALADRETKRIEESASGRIKRLVAEIQLSLAEAGRSLLPVAAFVLEVVQKIIGFISAIPAPIQMLLKISIAFAALVGPLVMIAGLFGNLAGQVMKGFVVFRAFGKKNLELIDGQKRFSQIVSQMANPAVQSQTKAFNDMAVAVERAKVQLEELTKASAIQNRTALLQQRKLLGMPNFQMKMDKQGRPYHDYTDDTRPAGVGARRPSNQAIDEFYAYTGGERPETKTMVAQREKAKVTGISATEAEKAADGAAKERKEVEGTAQARRANLAAMGGSLAMMGLLVSNGNEFITKMSTGLLVLSLMTPLLRGIWGMVSSATAQKGLGVARDKASAFWLRAQTAHLDRINTSQRANAQRSLAASRQMGTMAGKLKVAGSAARLLGRGLLAMLGPVGLIIAAFTALGAIFAWNQRRLEKQRQQVTDIANGAKDLADVVGVAFKASSGAVDQYGNDLAKTKSKVDALRKANRAYYDELRAWGRQGDTPEGDDQIIARVSAEAGKVRQGALNAGVDKEEAVQRAKKAAAVMLAVMGQQRLQLRFDEEVDLGNTAHVMADLRRDLEREVDEALGERFSERIAKSLEYGASSANLALSNAGGQASKEFAKRFADSMGPNIVANDAAFTDMQNLLKNKVESSWKEAGIELSAEDLLYIKAAGVDPSDKLGIVNLLADLREVKDEAGNVVDPTPNLLKIRQGYQGIIQVQEDLIERYIKTHNVSDEVAKRIRDIFDLQRETGNIALSPAEAEAGYNAELREREAMLARIGKTMGNADIISLRNQWRLRAGIASSTELMESFGGATLDAANAMGTLSDEAKAMFARRAAKMLENIKGNIGENLSDGIEIIMDAYDNMSKAREESYDNQIKAADDAYEAEADRIKDRYEAATEAMDERQEDEMSALEKRSDAAIDAIDKEADAEKKLDDLRQRLFDRERMRLQRLKEDADATINFNMAFNEGNLDEAARVMSESAARQIGYNMDDAEDGADAANQGKEDAREARKKRLQDEKDSAVKNLRDVHEEQKRTLKDQQEAELRGLEARKEARRRDLENAKENNRLQRAMDRERLEQRMNDEKTVAMRNSGEWQAAMTRIRSYAEGMGVKITQKNDEWSKLMETGWTSAVSRAQTQLLREEQWSNWAGSIADEVTRGLLGMNWEEFTTYLTTGEKPKPKPAEPPRAAVERGTVYPGSPMGSMHSGGPVGSAASSRAGRPMNAPLYPDEVPTILQRGEYVVKRDAVAKVGTGFLDGINQGKKIANDTGFFHSGGLVGSAGIMMGEYMKAAMTRMVEIAARRKDDELIAQGRPTSDTVLGGTGMVGPGGMGPAPAGNYGDNAFTASQLANANIIINTGKAMGASERDIIIGLMTAMQESTLNNIAGGDRDSLGLFQQRPSQGWGTPTEIMNPAYAARKFFEGLLKVDNRNDMPLTMAAQAVQRSAFPNAYAKWENEARAIYGASLGTGMFGREGMWPPAIPGRISANTAAAKRYVAETWPVTRGGSADLARADGQSDHGRGKALDIFPGNSLGQYAMGENLSMGNAIAMWFTQNAAKFGTKYVIWQRKINQGRGWQDYNRYGENPGPTLGHYDHVHVSFLHGGGEVGKPQFSIPALKTGGTVKYDNTLANLHRNETVLTSSLSSKLENGINQLDSGSNVQYNININGVGINDPEAIANVVVRKIQRIEQVKGPARVVR